VVLELAAQAGTYVHVVTDNATAARPTRAL
jgi:hypothetical protein